MIYRLIKFLHDLIARVKVPYLVLAMATGGLVVFIGLLEYNQSSSFCQGCHINRGPYKNIDLDSVAHRPFKEGKKECHDCHTDKEYLIATMVAATAKFSQITNNRPHGQYKVRDVRDGKCMECHTDVLSLKQADALELSPVLMKIGLRFDHEKHYLLKEYNVDIRQRLDKLFEKGQAGNLTDEEKADLEFFNKVRIGNCAHCHEKDRLVDEKTGKRVETRQVNFHSTNPIRCSGCHVDTVLGVHPAPPEAPPVQLPSEQICRRCHNGKMHGRIITFPAKCDSEQPEYTEHCIKCHPAIKPGIRKERGHAPHAVLSALE